MVRAGRFLVVADLTPPPRHLSLITMHRTIFTTPVVNTALRGLSLAYLRAKGWQVDGSLPANAEKCVLIAAPHTSNWDLPYTLMVAFLLRLNVYWVGKASLFKWPFGPVMRWLGGIAVNREQSTGRRLGPSPASRRRPRTTGGRARGHPQQIRQSARLENRFLLHRRRCRRAHPHGLPRLHPKTRRPGADTHAEWRCAKRHGNCEGVLCAYPGQTCEAC
jgi:1-acyl-sn-glycerol-3-phosphate acyltransferase